ncbi:MAG: hypothetical protein WCH43_03455 [Verrucomicrobiota bacterium]
MVSANPELVVTFNPALTVALRRYRVFIGKTQTALVTNVKEISRLYLTRDASNRPELPAEFPSNSLMNCNGSTATVTAPYFLMSSAVTPSPPEFYRSSKPTEQGPVDRRKPYLSVISFDAVASLSVDSKSILR